jgi:hypothetical protein
MGPMPRYADNSEDLYSVRGMEVQAMSEQRYNLDIVGESRSPPAGILGHDEVPVKIYGYAIMLVGVSYFCGGPLY